MMRYLISLLLTCVFLSVSYGQNNLTLRWEKVAPGIWKTTIGALEQIDLLRAAGAKPRMNELSALGENGPNFDFKQIEAERFDGKTILRFPLLEDEKIYGLGLNFKTVNQRGKIKELHVDHFGGDDNGRTHAPVPFFVSDKGYGVFLNSSRYIKISVGCIVRRDAKRLPPVIDRNVGENWDANPPSDVLEAAIPGSGMEVYIFEGPDMLKVVQRFNLFCGGGFIPPKWGLGFSYRFPTLSSDKNVVSEIEQFQKHNFPLSVIGLEPGWQSMSYPCTFEWDKNRFPNPVKFVNEMTEKGIHVNLWLNPYISPKSSCYEKLKQLSGSHLVWNGIVPDYSLSKAQDIFKNFLKKEHVDLGISGYKIDEVDGFDEWLWLDHAKFPSGLSGEQMRQVYGLLMQKISSEIYEQKNTRTYGLVRSSNAGGVSFPYVIYNDYYNHRDFITALINSSFIGVQWTPEVRSSKTAEEWVRRMQTACFSPMAMINAWADGTKPWTFTEVEDIVRDISFLRNQFLPYIYTCYANYYFKGIPPFMAMNLLNTFKSEDVVIRGALNATDNPYAKAINSEMKDQYMVGENLLVAPLFAGEKSRKVVLPIGNWYDFYTGEKVGNGEIIEVNAGLNKIPLFVKEGGIIPLTEKFLKTPQKGDKLNLEVRVYGKVPTEYFLYDDDGTTYDYQKGLYSLMRLWVEKDKEGNLKGHHKMVKGISNQYYNDISWKFMTK